MSRIQPPQFLSDLYRDLRDRRLLIPAVALLVAVVAVPVVLKSSPEAVVPPPAPAAGAGATAAEPAVLAEQTGIRNYRERLEALQAQNPFDQKFSLPEPGTADVEEVDGGLDTAAVGGSTAAADSSGLGIEPVADAGLNEPVASTDSGSSSGDVTVSSASGSSGEPKPEIRFYAGRVDVSIGPIGDRKERRNVRYLEFLPGDKSPVVAFLGLAEGGEHAIFAISRDVTDTDGEGSCAPKRPDPCQFLTLGVGEERFIHYGLDGRTYVLKLLDTDVVRVPDPREPADQ